MDKLILAGTIALGITMAAIPVAQSNDDLIMGWIEEIAIKPWNLVTKAKLDTGADTASLHGKDITRFVQDGSEWIRFILELEGEQGEVQTYKIERPVTRNVKIKRHGTEYQVRPVINMEFCMGSQVYTSEFSVTDRTQFNYPVLLGRNFLDGRGLVDSSSTHRTRLRCEEPINASDDSEPAAVPAAADKGIADGKTAKKASI